MADGKPVTAFAFQQTDASQPEVLIATPEAVEQSPQDRKELKLHNRLLADGQWAENPHVDDQESRFPDSVRTHAVIYRLFNVSTPTEMQEYSQIFMSNAKRGRYVFDSPEDIKWDLPNGRCFILVRVEERRFLTLKTTESTPE